MQYMKLASLQIYMVKCNYAAKFLKHVWQGSNLVGPLGSVWPMTDAVQGFTVHYQCQTTLLKLPTAHPCKTAENIIYIVLTSSYPVTVMQVANPLARKRHFINDLMTWEVCHCSTFRKKDLIEYYH